MLAPPARRRLFSQWPPCALVFPSLLACGAPPSIQAGAVAPAAPPSASRAAEAADEAASPSPSNELPAPDATAVSVVALVAKPGLWPLDVDSAKRVLQAFGPVTRQQPAPDELALVGGPYGALDRYSVAYTLDDQSYWVFGSAGFFLAGSDQARLYHLLEARLIQLLGKPAWRDDESGAALPTSGWDLGESVTLSLAPSPEGGERSVQIAISEPAAGAD